MRQIINGKVYDTDKLELLYIKENKKFKELYSYYKDRDNPDVLLREHFNANSSSLTLVIKDNYQMEILFNSILSQDNKITIKELELLFNYKILRETEQDKS